jgi:hypothetical protein
LLAVAIAVELCPLAAYDMPRCFRVRRRAWVERSSAGRPQRLLHTPEAREKGMLNRAVLIVRPKQPYIDWAAGLDDSGLVPDAEDEQTVYLIPSYEDDDEAWEIVEEVYETVFENELYDWHTDESAWPQDRDFAMFQEWFDIELHSVVEDLCDDELLEDEA